MGIAQSITIPAPIQGWNGRDSLSDMDSSYAVQLDNLYPYKGALQLRSGYGQFAQFSDLTNVVRSLMPYTKMDGTQKLFAGTQKGIFDVTAGGTITSAATLTSTNGAWMHTQVTTPGGTFLWCCNGTDASKVFDGTTWTDLSGSSSPALTGVASANVAFVTQFKTRVFLCCNNSLSFFYLPLQSVGGAANEFSLAGICREGGYLMSIGSLTLDGGLGPDDYFCAITSQGEVVIYKGTDPSIATSWALAGVFKIAFPTGRRCMTKVKGDLIISTIEGPVSVIKLLQSGPVQSESFLSDAIKPIIASYAIQYGSTFGWQVMYWPTWSMLLLNIPQGSGSSVQCIFNTEMQAWCRFVGYSGECMGLFNNQPYFANGATIYQAWQGLLDNGNGIILSAKSSFNYFGRRGNNKQIQMLRLLTRSNTTVNVQLGIAEDFADGAFRGSAGVQTANVAVFDTAQFDNAVFAGSDAPSHNWRSVANWPGKAKALLMQATCKSVTFNWFATEMVLRQGGIM